MNFIGLRLCEHDTNITYTDGVKVRYYKSERDLQSKHHGHNSLNLWTNVIKRWGVTKVDAIAIVMDTHKHPFIKTDCSKLFEILDVPMFKDMGFDCPVFRVDHHYAHILSYFMLGDKYDYGFVFDGYGDNENSHTIMHNGEKLVQYDLDEMPSFGQILGNLGGKMGMEGHVLDRAGKIMAKKAYGATSNHLLNKVKRKQRRFDLHFLDYLWTFDMDTDEDTNQGIYFAHEITEDLYVKHFTKYCEKSDIVYYSGGIAQNTIINTKLRNKFPNLVIGPHCADDGLSLGAVEFLRQHYDCDPFDVSGFPYWQDDEAPEDKPSTQTIKQTAERLARGEIVGWYQGNGEIGPRALGHRSILMNPLIRDGKDIINTRVKHREPYRPFGASILSDATGSFFEDDRPSPYMLYLYKIKHDGFDSITHRDGTCRLQTVNDGVFGELLEEFGKLTGVPMLLNTSLNNGGKPICGSINDAIELYHRSDMNTLVAGNRILNK